MLRPIRVIQLSAVSMTRLSRYSPERASREEHTPDRVAAGVGGYAPAAPREGEGLDPLP